MREKNLTQFIISQTSRYKNRSAFIKKGLTGERHELSFRQFNEIVYKISEMLRTKYNKPGFKIALWGENRIEWCALAYGVWHAGGVLIPIMHIATDGEVQNILAAAQVDALFISPKLEKT